MQLTGLRAHAIVFDVNATRPARQRTLKNYLDFVKFEHTLFALPFAYGGMLLATRSWPGWSTFLLITLAMVGARTASMALNRVIDASIDAKNPRTKNREIPAGKLGKKDGYALAIIGFLLLIIAGWALNPLTLALLPVAVFFLALYPYTKRFTYLCHYWLGVTIGASAAGGWIAVTGSFAPAAIALWAGVALWIAGFDIIYGMLDYDFDVKHNVHSVPADLGLTAAKRIAILTHVTAFIALLLVLPFSASGWPYATGLMLTAGILVWQHWLVAKEGAGKALASFNANLYVSMIMLLAIITDITLR